ncbi:Fumarylacetoacetate hydrolase domain-containing protein 2 [Nymphon striatum]|nr:Fumarylacetoacetate hydrolase domain-containing protein 2 [Nymphon striatum]
MIFFFFSKMGSDSNDLKEYLAESEDRDIEIESQPDHLQISLDSEMRQSNSENSSLISDELKPLSKEKKIVLATIVIADILCFVASGSPAPFFPQEAYLKDQNAKAVGFITSSYHLGALLISPLCGFMVSKIGIKCMFLIGMIVITIATGVSSVALRIPTGNPFFAYCAGMRFIQGAGSGALQTSLYAFITTEFADRVSSAAGFLEMAFGVGYALGPLLGGLLYTAGGFPLPFIVTACMCFVMVPVSWFLLPVSVLHEKDQSLSASKSSLRLLTIPSIYLPLSVVILAMGNLAYIFMAYPLQASKDFDASPSFMGLLFGVASAEYALVAPLVGFIVDKKGYLTKKQMVIIGDLVIAFAFIFMGPAPFLHIDRSLWQLAGTLVLFLIGQCSAYVPSFGFCVDEARYSIFSSFYNRNIKLKDADEAELKGMISGLMSTTSVVGAFIGPVLGGVFLDHFGWSWTAVILSALTTLNLHVGIIKKLLSRKKLDNLGHNTPVRFEESLYLRLHNKNCKKVQLGLELSRGGDVVSLSNDSSLPCTMMEFLEKLEDNLIKAKRVLDSKDRILIPRSSIDITAPITKPDKVLCVGMNYKDHCEEQNVPLPVVPIIFNKFPSCIVGPTENIPVPEITEELDWEVELVIVVGKKCKNVSEKDADEYIFGYTAAHDVSARDWQLKKNGGQWLVGKAMDAFCPLGPCIVTKDSIDANNLDVSTRVNGIVKQKSNTCQLVHKSSNLISFCSKFVTLLPGDVILTGTPGGVGIFRKPPEFLKKGDLVEIEIQDIGTIRNEIV